MKNMMKWAVLPVIISALFAFVLPASVWALGIGMAPTELEIENALRGGEYERVVTVFNPSADDTVYNLRADGQASGWLSFYDWNDKKAVERLTIPGESNNPILVKINVPSDVPNDIYTATIYAETSPGTSPGDMGVATIMRASSVLTITVSDIQILSGTVGTISAHDTEAGFPLGIEVSFRNKGNVAAQPRIDCRISNGNTQVADFSYGETTVKPESQETITVEWPTTADQTGDYVAQVAVSLGQEILATKELTFKVLPPGAFSKQGELTSLAFEGEPLLGTMLKIQGAFQNTGQGDARAKLIAEVYLNDKLIDTVASEETLVPIGESGILISYLKLEQAGAYTIRGYATYEGKQTETKETSFSINGGNAGDGVDVANPGIVAEGGQPPGLPLPVIIGIIAAASAVTVLLVLRRKRQRAF